MRLQQRKSPAKRAFPGLAGSPTAHVVETDELRKQREKEEAKVAAKASAVDATIDSMKKANDANRIGAIPAETPKRGRPRLPGGPKSPAVRKKESRERKILLELARRKAIKHIADTATLQSSETTGRQSNEVTASNATLDLIYQAAWQKAQTGVGGGRRVKPSGHDSEEEKETTKETDWTFVKRQNWPLNWRLSLAEMEYYVAELTGGLLDSEGNTIPGIFKVVETDDGAVGVCDLCGATVEGWNDSPPYVSLGKPGRDALDTRLGGACAHLWLVHKKLVNARFKEVMPARVDKSKKSCPREDHEQRAKNIAANGDDGAFCGVCHEWIDAAMSR
jgi:hypothetical protein